MSNELEFRYCFLPGPARTCTSTCMAYVDNGKTMCRILNVIDKLVPPPTRPLPPTPPKVNT